MEITLRIVSVCTVVCLASALHLEYNALSLELKEGRHSETPGFQTCPQGFVKYRDSCFHVAHDLANWPEAVVYCQVYGGHLAFIDSPEENKFVTSYLKNSSALTTDKTHYFWIGGTDAVSENHWYWANTVKTIQYFNWGPGQPDNNHALSSKHQDCLAIYGSTGQWDDGFCEMKHNFLCEIDLDVEQLID